MRYTIGERTKLIEWVKGQGAWRANCEARANTTEDRLYGDPEKRAKLADMPLGMEYATEVAGLYPERVRRQPMKRRRKAIWGKLGQSEFARDLEFAVFAVGVWTVAWRLAEVVVWLLNRTVGR